MTPFESMAKLLLLAGLLLSLLGGLLLLAGKLPGLGKLPGDIFIQKGNFTFYFPVVTSVILSILLTFILNILFRR
ncbi:DUF2905 domain-containing protein [Desulforamulus hydrothermalis]|uniref:DUF2905 domain-containing protein n=1 Tax=Desulforamulus hydrothermalis Lam5 = DSM 18033 TaxID=1121428 RepID=K8DXA9_9FIRM|nr:DUF2905 domain-containing protein [Desulforamulus hydrothermalis]CCO07227.1 conserved exported hypothetical protein [Desulforamulus hydrothermalis Lam5 = DSM 18033]SHG87561.1 Protein of unknown function [Desulforamulus hydrothermalis Lam5 = DSM 18033]